MPEYQTEHIIEFKTLEAGSITIENITWQSEPEYDGDTEGEYIFTAVLPGGYILTNGVNAPQITVTVGGTNNIMLLSNDGSKDNWPGNPHKKNPNDRYTTFDCVYFGHYWYYDTDGEVDQSDAKEPIKWRVLSVDESGDAFLMADRIVDAQPYNKTKKSGVTWENCTLRSWLNGYSMEKNGEEDYSGAGMSFFDNAFNDEEKNAILETEVEKKDNSEDGVKDKVYLLSISEVTNPAYGFSTSKSSSDDSRLADPTKYEISANPYYEYHWYLRSMVDKGSSTTPTATLIDGSYGTVEENIYGISVASAMGVRPVLHLDLNNKDVWEPACPVQGKHIVLHRSFGPWHSEPWKDRHEHICADETCVRLDPYNSSASEPCSGGTAGYTKKAICTTCGGEYGALLTDNTPPTGKVSAGTDQWDDVVSGATFELFFNESKDVSISAADGESGVASISYYLTDRELTREDLIDIESWQPTDVDYEKEEDWQATDTVRVPIEPDTECILYAKIIDGVGNTTYLSSDGMVFDGTAPKIEGVEAGGTYCAPRNVTVTVTDDYLDSVTLNGESVALSADGTSCTFTLSEAERSLTIKASDKAENSTTVTVTVKEDHTFGDWEESIGKNRSKTCENCGHKYTETDEERLKAAKEIVEEFLGKLSAPEDMEADELRQMVEDKLAREGFSDVKVTMDEFHKEESSGQKAGKVWGDVTLELREASEDVDFDIPLTNDRQRVQRAKEIVEQTLSEMTVSNDTTAEDIQDAIDAALRDAGLEDVKANVDDFNIEEATEESEGRITGTVTLEKGEETGEVEIDKKIGRQEQTPGTIPEQTPEASVDRPNGKIKGLVPGAEYDITYTDADGQTHTDRRTADENGNLEIEDEWTGGTVDIVKKGNGDDTADSQPQELEIPEREPAPSDAGMSKKASKDGKGGSIGGLTPGETYQISKDGEETWEDVTADDKGEISPIGSGSYDIRKKAGDNTLPSKSVQVEVTKEEGSSGGSTDDSSGNTGSGGPTGGNNGGSSSGSGNGSQSSGNNSGGTGTGNNAASGTQTSTDTSGNTQTGADTTGGTQSDMQTGTGTRNGRGNSTGTNKAGASSSSNTGVTDNKDSSQSASADETTNSTAESSIDTDQGAGQSDASGTDGQPTGSTAQTVKAELKDGKITVEGDVVVTGTVRTAETTTKTLIVGEGSVIVTVVSDEYKGNAGVADTVAVANAVLTPEQIQRVNDGEKIEIRVEVTDISAQVSQEDKDIIENGLAAEGTANVTDGDEAEELTLGAYIDISMYIKIGDGDWDAITRADEPIEVVVGIPEELQADGRIYYIARAHEGEYALLEDLDDEADTITIKTGMFSTYAIAFRQMPGAGADASSGFLASLSWTAVALWSLGILVMIALAVILILGKRRKEEEDAS